MSEQEEVVVVAEPKKKRFSQAERYNRLKAQGICISCGKEPVNLYALHCDGCHATIRDSLRAKLQSKPWRPGGRGRRPRDYKDAE